MSNMMLAPVFAIKTGVTVCTSQMSFKMCVYVSLFKQACAVYMSVYLWMYVHCVSNICDLEVSGCTCQIEMWGCSVIFM